MSLVTFIVGFLLAASIYDFIIKPILREIALLILDIQYFTGRVDKL